MLRTTRRLAAFVLAGLLTLPATQPATAFDLSAPAGFQLSLAPTPSSTVQPTLHAWMHPEIAQAWSQGFMGQGARIVVVDDFNPFNLHSGNLGFESREAGHGFWVRTQVEQLAPLANIVSRDFRLGTAIGIHAGQLNIFNLSYAIYGMARDGMTRSTWSDQETRLIMHANSGRGIVVKAAGNDRVAVGGVTGLGRIDHLNVALIGAPTAIFAGALDRHGTTANRANIAFYSNRAGDDPVVQQQFLMVGVPREITGLPGTSFAAPVISAYAAVVGSKFRDATPTEIVRQLLDTARTDTINGYAPNIHGRGEASIARALAPVSIR